MVTSYTTALYGYRGMQGLLRTSRSVPLFPAPLSQQAIERLCMTQEATYSRRRVPLL